MNTKDKMEFPSPKFQFGQRVQIRHDNQRDCTHEGVIIGMTYFSPIHALKAGEDHQGWQYTVSLIDAIPVGEVVQYDQENSQVIWESDQGLKILDDEAMASLNDVRNAIAV